MLPKFQNRKRCLSVKTYFHGFFLLPHFFFLWVGGSGGGRFKQIKEGLVQLFLVETSDFFLGVFFFSYDL